MAEFFNLKGSVVYRVLHLVSSIMLWLTILACCVSLLALVFGDGGASKGVAFGCLIASFTSFIYCLFMYGFCYLIKVANAYDKEEQDDEAPSVAFKYKGYKGTLVRDEETGKFHGEVIGYDKSYGGNSYVETELSFQNAVDELREDN